MTTFCVISEMKLRAVLALISFGTVFLYAVFGSYSQADDVEVDSGGWGTSVRPRRLLAGPLRRSYEEDEEGFDPDTIIVSSRWPHSKIIHRCYIGPIIFTNCKFITAVLV